MKIKNRTQLFSVLESAGYPADRLVKLRGMKPADARKAIEEDPDISLAGVTGLELENILTKTVTIEVSADAGEEVEITSPQAAGPAETNADKMEEEEEEAKARKPVGSIKAGQLARHGAGPSIGSGINAKKAAYANAAAQGKSYRGHTPPVADPDLAEYLGAWARSTIMEGKDYGQRDNDLAIVENCKALGTGNNLLGGATVPVILQSELIENRAKYGASTRAIGVTTMEIGQTTASRLIDDVSVSVIGENLADTDQDKPELDLVEMNTREVRGLVRMSLALLNDSAIDIAGAIGRSFDRAYGKFSDLNFLLARSATGSSPSFEGMLDKIGSNTTYDAGLTAAWSEFTITQIQEFIALVSDRTWDASDRVGFICSRPFFDSVLDRFAMSAGGNTGDMLNRGFRQAPDGADATWNGYPVWFTPKMPRVYAGDAKVCLFGGFDAASKVGEVLGGESLQTSEHRYFENNQVAVRAVRRLAFNAHDVNDVSDPDTGSMVVALQD